ncbi:gliding motility lipoprotein GldB [Cyclobacterium amurskyense]|uniref:GldB n=1 Tax=Cyclobacterium amurskyense TaxID=320787 RepID=A0A0H4PB56_9BACT|nr:gliding motility lipoprotein GldB [Cyclobacterium amurskyense]AKP51676.1 GldB [Cyclobacterium amurskyense]|tara:strand:+ start:15164 stop:16171 length:1008 start_codon:yes stop_codon:yes gene_type:complete
MKQFKFLLPVLLPVAFLFGCNQSNEQCELPSGYKDNLSYIDIIRMENLYFENITKEKILANLESYPEFSKAMFANIGLENQEQLAEELLLIHQDSGMIELYQEVKKIYGDISDIKTELENAFAGIKYHYPDYKIPTVYTFVSGFGSDLIVTDEVIIIGLDYFLPEDHKFQPVDLPNYILKRYNRAHLVPTIVTAISSQFNKTKLTDRSLLAEMIYYGKSYHFTKTILPCTSDELIIGYETEEILGSYANEEMIWGHFIENELLFETNPFVIRKYTGEAPFTDEISPDAPGRIGRWIGWNIVDDYKEKNGLSLTELMEQDDAQLIFKNSGYKPRRL